MIERLHHEGAWVFKVHGSRYQRAGVGDVLAVYWGVALMVEVKRPGEKPSPLQERELAAFRKAGGRTAVVTAATQVDELLAGIRLRCA